MAVQSTGATLHGGFPKCFPKSQKWAALGKNLGKPPCKLGLMLNPSTKLADLAYDWLRHFGLLLLYCLTEFKEPQQEVSTQPLLPSLCFLGKSVNKDGHDLASDSLRHFWLLCNLNWIEFEEPSQETSINRPLPIVCSTNKALASDWLSRHFRLLLCNYWKELDKLDREQVVLFQGCRFLGGSLVQKVVMVFCSISVARY